jgi:hypothetical protein
MDPARFEHASSGPKPEALSKLNYGSELKIHLQLYKNVCPQGKSASGETRTLDLQINSLLLYLLSFLGLMNYRGIGHRGIQLLNQFLY